MHKKTLAFGLALSLPLALVGCGGTPPPADGGAASAPPAGPSGGRDNIRIVGSSTVYPFSTTVAEQLGRTTSFKTPVVESTGTGGGFKLFCAGLGVQHPDISNASRRIKSSEIEQCAANGVDEVTEVNIGYDGIVVANAKGAPRYDLTRHQIFLALAKQVPTADGQLKDNPYVTWRQIDAALPDRRIEVYGPPPTSGTRDAFVELVMEEGCKEIAWVADLAKSDEDRFKSICHGVREDGGYVEAGENDNLIVQKLEANADALGIFGFSFLDQNTDKVQGSLVEGVEPTFESIADGSYSVSRPLFIYVKKAHVGTVPGMQEFVAEFVSPAAIGEDGYLADLGLIPLPDELLAQVRGDAQGLVHNLPAAD